MARPAAAVTLSTEWDYIVVGAGSAGAALAATLARADVGTVLLLEGAEAADGLWFDIPLGVAYLLLGEHGVARYFTVEQPRLAGRPIFWPRGKGPGGSSRVNGMIWSRGDPAEYDRWAAQGLSGWSYASLLEHFQAAERYAGNASRTRGRAGAIAIEEYTPRDPLTRGFLAACAELGYPTPDDYNDGKYEGAGVLQLTTRRGVRCSTREAFLAPARRLANFRLAAGVPVTGVEIAEGRATGVRCALEGRAATLRARREVILCAGAIQSPQLLELSGVGDGTRLQALGVKVAHHLPPVGENLRDHLHVRVNFRATGNVTTVNDLHRSVATKLAQGVRYAVRRNGLLSTATCTAHALVRSDPDDPQPDVKLQLHLVTSADARDPSRYVLDRFPGFSIAVFQLRPRSRGSVHLASGDPRAPPRIDPDYLADAHDRAVTLRGLRLARTLAARRPLARYVQEEVRPGPAAQSDDALLEHVARSGTTSYHPIGTCRMGDAGDSVVDARLRVHGVRGLRVADASVMPSMPSSNTHAPAVVIGLKGARMIAEDARAS